MGELSTLSFPSCHIRACLTLPLCSTQVKLLLSELIELWKKAKSSALGNINSMKHVLCVSRFCKFILSIFRELFIFRNCPFLENCSFPETVHFPNLFFVFRNCPSFKNRLARYILKNSVLFTARMLEFHILQIL